MLGRVPPRNIGPYEILSLVGRGGIGTVYRARHRESGAVAAVKVLGPTPGIGAQAARRLAREFEALRVLDHPNVIRVYEAGVSEGYSYLAMELVEGLDLRCYLSPELDREVEGLNRSDMPTDPTGSESGVFGLEAFALEPATDSLHLPDRPPAGHGPDAIRAFAEMLDEPETDSSDSGVWPAGDDGESGPPWAGGGTGSPSKERPAASGQQSPPIPPSFARLLNDPRRLARMRHVLVQVCRGLTYVHSCGLVHRDLKPSNIMVDDHRRARIMDFGLVKSVDEALPLTVTGRVVGTYRYMSPEQAQGKAVDPRSDLYSLGVILYELLCGRPPFVSQRPSELWHDIVEHAPPPLISLNPGADLRLARISAQLMAKDPDDRFQSAADLIQALEQ
jgi:serine/threonine protein kinase